jgi:hypothetical protein
MNWTKILDAFLIQAEKGDLKTASYPKQWDDMRLRVSFGMGAPARVPWIAFVAPEMQVSNGFYPVYLYYKSVNTLILAYGVSETQEFSQTWPEEIINGGVTLASYFNEDIPRYGDSFLFKSYRIEVKGEKIKYFDAETKELEVEKDIEADLQTILEYYKKAVSINTTSPKSELGQGLFYMEKQLEDFLIQNWEHSELGQKYDLIVEEGELISQQYRTDIGPIDILVKDKKTKNFVVIELKRNQTSDDTIGQLTRYMGWVRKHKNDNDVRGIIIGGQYDKKLEYAREMVPNIEVFLYEVDFKLREFK